MAEKNEDSEVQPDPEIRTVHVPGQEQVEIPTSLPVLPVRDVVVFPGVTVPLAIGRENAPRERNFRT